MQKEKQQRVDGRTQYDATSQSTPLPVNLVVLPHQGGQLPQNHGHGCKQHHHLHRISDSGTCDHQHALCRICGTAICDQHLALYRIRGTGTYSQTVWPL